MQTIIVTKPVYTSYLKLHNSIECCANQGNITQERELLHENLNQYFELTDQRQITEKIDSAE